MQNGDPRQAIKVMTDATHSGTGMAFRSRSGIHEAGCSRRRFESIGASSAAARRCHCSGRGTHVRVLPSVLLSGPCPRVAEESRIEVVPHYLTISGKTREDPLLPDVRKGAGVSVCRSRHRYRMRQIRCGLLTTRRHSESRNIHRSAARLDLVEKLLSGAARSRFVWPFQFRRCV